MQESKTDDLLISEFWDRVYKLASEREVPIGTLSKKLGMDRAYLAICKSRSTRPPFDKVIRIAEFFHVSIDYLITGKSSLSISDDASADLIRLGHMLEDPSSPEYLILSRLLSENSTQFRRVASKLAGVTDSKLNAVYQLLGD